MLGTAEKLVPTLRAECPSLKHLHPSVVLLDPPYGWKQASWDQPEDKWSSQYFKTVLDSLTPVVRSGTLLVLFADPIGVLPSFLDRLKLYNSQSGEGSERKWIYANTLHFHKLNSVSKGIGPYANSVESAFLFYFGKVPKITKMRYELGGNLLTSSKLQKKMQIPVVAQGKPNPCQKPNLWLNILLENHVVDNSYVLDLTAGSFSSFLATYLLNSSIHWVGVDKDSDVLENFKLLLEKVNDEDSWWLGFKTGKATLKNCLNFIAAAQEWDDREFYLAQKEELQVKCMFLVIVS